ncbi:hypothetical protein [Rothia nasimurium]|uniref:hypothetical protein n=1 Tax=Rothia nasimurium TaxID=85336 RepID=UPI001F2E2C3F|nr:hypothetical protein [Rothia nasimurium]
MSDSTQPHVTGFHTTDPRSTGAATTLTIIGVVLLLTPVAHLLAVPLGLLGVPVAKEWVAYSYDPFSANILLAIVALAPGYFCLLAVLRRAPSIPRLIAAATAPTLVLLYALFAVYYYLTSI